MTDCRGSPALNQPTSALTSTHTENDQNYEPITSGLSITHCNGAYNVTGSEDDSCSHSTSDLALAAQASPAAAVDLFYTHICVKATSSPPLHPLPDAGCGCALNFHAHSTVNAAVESTVIQMHCCRSTQLSSSITDAPKLTSTKHRGRILYDRMRLVWTWEIQCSSRAVRVGRSCASALRGTQPMRRHTTDIDHPRTMGGRIHQGATTLGGV